jgi:hypothetical protein
VALRNSLDIVGDQGVLFTMVHAPARPGTAGSRRAPKPSPDTVEVIRGNKRTTENF